MNWMIRKAILRHVGRYANKKARKYSFEEENETEGGARKKSCK